MRSTLMQALVSLATNASFGFSYTNFAKLRIYTLKEMKALISLLKQAEKGGHYAKEKL